MPFDIFQPDTGLKDDYDGTIESALFVQTDQGSWQAQLVVSADDGEEPVIKLGLGKGWQSYDGGETVSGASTTSRFNNKTAYSKFMSAAMDAGAADEMKTRSDTLYDGLGPLHANFWVGLRFHFDVVMDLTAQQRNDETGEWEKVPGGRPVITPTKFLGTTAVFSNGSQPSMFDAADEASIAEVAKSSADYATFCAGVMGLTDSTGQPMAKNRAVMAKLANQGWYEELKG